MFSRRMMIRNRGSVSWFLMLGMLGCSAAPSTGALLQSDFGGSACKGDETFQQARTVMFKGCSGFGQFACHGRMPFDGGLDLTAANAYKALVGVPATIAPTKLRVQPGNSAASFVVQKLTNTQGANEGGPMPDPVEGLKWSPPDPAKLAIVRCWIENGAQNN